MQCSKIFGTVKEVEMALIASWSNSGPGTGKAGRPSGWRRWRVAWSDLRQRWQALSWQRRVREEESYLAESVDLYDLDRRMRELDREEQRGRFIGYF
jgi:hypothetical protein